MTQERSTILVQGEEKRAMVRAMFDSVAPRYDLLNRLISCGLDMSWRKRTIAALGLPEGSRVLDLACGTGDLCRLLDERGLLPIGLDMSEGMLRKGRSKAPLVLGDAVSLPLGDGSVDGVVCAFGLRNFTEIPAVVAELARVVRPGGRIALLEVAVPAGSFARAGYKVWFEHAVPAIGSLVSDRDAYHYLPESVEYLPPPAKLLATLRSAQFGSAQRRTFSGGATQLLTATRTGIPQSAVTHAELVTNGQDLEQLGELHAVTVALDPEVARRLAAVATALCTSAHRDRTRGGENGQSDLQGHGILFSSPSRPDGRSRGRGAPHGVRRRREGELHRGTDPVYRVDTEHRPDTTPWIRADGVWRSALRPVSSRRAGRSESHHRVRE